MIRHRWIEAGWPINMRTLAQRIQENRFSIDKKEGFILDKFRSDCVEGRFVEKIAYVERVINPLGGEQKLERLEFRVSKFRAVQNEIGLELINEPRSTKAFTNKISEICDYSLPLKPISIDPLRWGDIIDKNTIMKCMFTSVQLSKLALSEGVTAQVAISGKNEVRNFLSEIASGRKYIIDKAKLEINYGYNFYIVLGRQATVSCLTELSEEILDIVRHSLIIAKHRSEA